MSRGLMACMAAALFGLSCDPAHAQDATVLDPVVVSAERRDALQTETAVSVSAFGGKTLEHADVGSIKEVSALAPNVNLVEFSARAISNPQVRGVGGSTTNPGVTTYVDGVPQLSADTSSSELLDIADVEFVRGAQGTLYGRNTLGGVINLQSRLPGTQWASNGDFGIGSRLMRIERLSVSGPLTDDLSLGLAAGHRTRDGYSVNLQTGQPLDSRDAVFGKAQLLGRVGGWQLRLLASAESAHDGDFALYDLATLRAHPYQVRHDYTGSTYRVLQSQTLLADHAGEWASFRSISGRVSYQAHEATDLDASERAGLTRDNMRRGSQLTQELQWLSPAERPWVLADGLTLHWIAGLFGFSQRNDQGVTNFIAQSELLDQAGSFLPLPPLGVGLPPLGTILDMLPVPLPQFVRAEDRSRAALRDWGAGLYAQPELRWGEHWRLAAGARYDHEHKRADLHSGTVAVTNAGEIPAGAASQVQDSRSYGAFSPRLRLAYQWIDALAYVSVDRGYRAGGFNPIAPAGQETYGEEHSRSVEAGFKATFWEQRAQLSMAAFRIDLSDLQLNVPVPNGAGRFYIRNAGSAQNQGVEAELRVRPWTWLEGYASAGTLSAHFGDGSRNLGTDISGKQLPFADPLTAATGIVLRRGGWSAQAGAQRFGGYYYSPDNTERLAPVTLVNARIGYRVEAAAVEAWGRNLGNRAYIPLAIPYTGIAPSGYVGEDAAPRTIGLSLRYDL